MAASTDYFKKVGNPGTATTLSAPGYTAGATSITVASTTNWPTDTGVTFCMYEVTTVGTETVMTAGTYNEYDGVVTGATSIGSLSHVAGSGTDRNYASGSGTVVTIMVTSGRENGIVDGLLVSHNQDGTLKNKVATLSKINGGSTDGVLLTDASGNVTGGKVTADKLNGGTTAGVLTTNASGVVSATPQWPTSETATNTTYNGNVVYVRTFTGTITASANARTVTSIIASGVTALLSVDGWWTFTSGFISGIGGADSAGRYSGALFSTSAGSVSIVTTSESARTNAEYMVRVFYTK